MATAVAPSAGTTFTTFARIGSSEGKHDDSNAATTRGGAQSVRVIVRIRPPNATETDRGEPLLVNAGSEQQVTVSSMGPGGREMAKNFRFDQVLAPGTSQEDCFHVSGVTQFVDAALSGYATCVFAYGQTGSGKTFTMSGLEESIAREDWSRKRGDTVYDGLIPRAMRYLFEHVQSQRDQGHTVRVSASFCEIYNEQVYDLLHVTEATLPVRWSAQAGFFVQGLMMLECEALDDVLAVLSEGHKNRRTGSHELNKDSSRSHSLMAVHVESEIADSEDGHPITQRGKIVFVDLAGSERLKETKSEGVTKEETRQINKSLFMLGKVISMLGDPKKKGTHVPYRDSKLTKLLMDSLGGSSVTLMIACCSPAASHLEETLNTLNYATRASNIKNKPMVHVDPQEQLIFNLRQEVKLLRMENEYLKSQLGMSSKDAPFPLPKLWPSAGSTRVGSADVDGSPARSQSVITGKADESDLLPPTVPSGGSPARPRPGRNQYSRGSQLKPRSASEMGHRLAPISTGSSNHVNDGTSPPLVVTPLVSPLTSPDPRPMLAMYREELERLHQENSSLRAANVNLSSEYAVLMADNDRMSSKLEHLELVFVHNGMPTTPSMGAPPARVDAEASRLRDTLSRVLADNERLQGMVRELQAALAARGGVEAPDPIVTVSRQRPRPVVAPSR